MAIQSLGISSPYLNYRGLEVQSKDQAPRDQALDVKAVKQNSKDKQTPEEQSAVQQLVNAEKKVIAHEQAHMSVGGQYAGGASYGYTNGPDGKRYITSGEVPISVPSTDDPEKMLTALRQVIKAALAPADPSPQDIKVAQSANSKLLSVNAEITAKKAAKIYGSKTGNAKSIAANSTFEIHG